jgi:hypothetical protein
MNPEKALEIVKNIRPEGTLPRSPEVQTLINIRDRLLKQIEMMEYEAKGIQRAINILEQS